MRNASVDMCVKQAERSSTSSDAATLQLQQLTDENTALLDAKVTAEKAAAAVLSLSLIHISEPTRPY